MQPGVLGLQLFDQTLCGALVHRGSVLDPLCPKEEKEEEITALVSWFGSLTVVLSAIQPLGVAQRGQRLLVADVRRAQSGDLENQNQTS